MDEVSSEDCNFFSRLKIKERQLITPKLIGNFDSLPHSLEQYLQAQSIFHRLILADSQPELHFERFLTLRNFIRQVGAIPAAWNQIRNFIGVARSYLEVTVHDHQDFLFALRAEGFAVNSWMEKVSRFAGHGHRFDSARARTEYRHDPQLHLVNDRADEETYGPNYFFVHWDAQSVYARRGSLLGRIVAGRTHAYLTASPEEVDEYLNRHLKYPLNSPVITE